MSKREKMWTNLAEWIICKYDTKSWRAGKTGKKHFPYDREVIDCLGRAELFSQAETLEQAGLLSVDWTPFHAEILKFHLDTANLDRLIAFAGWKDPRDAIDRARELVKRYESQAKNPQLHLFYGKLWEMLSAGTVPAILLGKQEGLKYGEDLLTALNAAADNTGEVWENVFSARLFGQAKYFKEHLRSSVARILQEYCLEEEENLTEDRILAEFGILTYSQTLECKGPVLLSITGADQETRQASGADFPFGMVLNAQTLEHAQVVDLPGITRVMTVENKTNYESLPYQSDTLYIYCHGFFSPKECAFLAGVEKLASPRTQFLHWSDLDYGGMRIFAFVKRAVFPRVQPFCMDRETFSSCLKRYPDAGRKLTERKRGLVQAMEVPELSELKACILEYGVEIEQEMLLSGRETEEESCTIT